MAISGAVDGKISAAFAIGSCHPDPKKLRRVRARTCRKRAVCCCKLEKGEDSAVKRPRWRIAGGAVIAGCLGIAVLGMFKLNNTPGCYGSGENGGNGGNGGHGGNGGNGRGGGSGGAKRKECTDAPVSDNEEEDSETPCMQKLLLSSTATECLDQSADELSNEAVQRFKGQASFDFGSNKFNLHLNKSDEFQPSFPNHQLPSSEEQSGGSLTWLAGLIDSALLQAGVKKNHSKLANDVASSVMEQLGRDDTLAKKFETGALKRLQQEAFADIMRARERLDKLEASLGELKKIAADTGAERTSVKARVAAGGAFVLVQEQSNLSSRAALEQCGLPAGVDVNLTFQTPFRDADVLTTKCVVGESQGDSRSLGGAIRLRKIHYAAQVTEDIKAFFVPVGAEAKDMTRVVNPVQDDALTRFSKTGPALLDYCDGTAIGASYETAGTLVSLSQNLCGWGEGNDPVCLSTLAQVIFQPAKHLLLSLSGVNRVWPSPPLPSTPGLHWSEMGPLVFSASSTSSSSSSSSSSSTWDWRNAAEFQAKGSSMQSVAVSGEMKLGGGSLGGWFQVERGDWLVHGEEQRRPQWFLSLATASGGVCIGRSRRDYLTNCCKANTEEISSSSSQLQIEAFVKLECGQGLWLQPGLVYVVNKQCQTPGVMIRAEWNL